MPDLLVPSNATNQHLHELIAKTRTLLASTLCPASRRAYASDWADWTHWTEAHQLCALPARPESVALYLADRSSTLRAATLARRLNAISHYHHEGGFLDSPTYHPLVRRTMKAIRKAIGTKQDAKDPLLSPAIRRIVAACPDDLAGRRDRALLLISFAGALRRSETGKLKMEALMFCPEGLIVSISKSKTDQEAGGQTVAIPFGKDRATCPVRNLRLYLDAAGITSGALFRRVDQVGRLSAAGLHKDSVGWLLKKMSARAGVTGNIAGHSTRSGCISEAAQNGVPTYVIKVHSRHRSTKMVDRYVRLGTGSRPQPVSRGAAWAGCVHILDAKATPINRQSLRLYLTKWLNSGPLSRSNPFLTDI